MTAAPDSCDVSFAVACYNGLPFLDEAIRSALDQRDVSVEVIVVDDHGTDGSKAAAEKWAARDGRVRVLQTPRNSGPGGARNLAIEHMRGRWYAVLDSDDLIAPERSRSLIDRAEREGADLIADDLAIFGTSPAEERFLKGSIPPEGSWIGPDAYFASTVMFGKKPNLGFLKPMIRKSVLDETGIRYNEELRIAEDDELIVRLLLAGRRYFVWPEAMYRYRKHDASISHRLSLDHAERMLASERAVRELVGKSGASESAYAARWQGLRRAVAFTRSIEALKARKPFTALAALAGAPGAIGLYRMPILARFQRLAGRGNSQNPQ